LSPLIVFKISVKLVYPEFSISCLFIIILFTPASEILDVLLILLIIRQGAPFLIFHLQSSNALAFKVKKIKYKNINISAVGGPCLAIGLANKVHTSVIFANKNLETVGWLKDILTTDYYHPSISNDIIGVEVCAAIKNIFSMVIGFSKGLYTETAEDKLKENNYLNTSASLISQSLCEMELFVNFLKGNEKTVYGLAGLGDLFVSSQGGRNSKMGEYMGKGYVYSEVKKSKMPTETVEGAELIFEIGSNIKNDFSIKKMPLLIGMVDAILNDKKFEINWEYLH